MLGLLPLSTTSVAVRVKVPLLLKDTKSGEGRAESGALAGKVAVESVEVIPTVSVTVLTRFQLVSTALTVTLTALETIWARGVPVFPLAVPGAALSPGTNSCSLANGPALTATLKEIALLKVPLVKTMVIVSATG